MSQSEDHKPPEIALVLVGLARKGFSVMFADSEDETSLMFEVIKGSDRCRREFAYENIMRWEPGMLARSIQEAAETLGH